MLSLRDDATLELQKAGHGEIVQTPAGEWYSRTLHCGRWKPEVVENSGSHDKTEAAQAHAGHRCVLGRETCLQQVEWRDGWLRLATGGCHPSSAAAAQGVGVSPWPESSARDDFDATQLDVR